MEDDREQRLAESLADFLDGRTPGADIPELAGELGALAEIDRAIDPAAALPERLSGHKIVAEIGSGGMGRVFLAMDEALGRKVAIKTLAPRYADDPRLRARFMGEARAMARLSHPNIARIYSLGPHDEPAHFVMEYLEGAPLTKAASRLTFEQKADLMRRVVLAVEFLHEQGILHRDLKPANILVGPDLEPKLLDFGLALDLGGHERLSQIGEVAGTPEYLSPEQARGDQALDARSDVFSLGAVLYELLTGAPPFRGDTVADLLRRIREEDPVLPRRRDAAIPGDLQNICLKALEKDPAQRYASAREMADDLRRFLASEAVLAAPAAYSRLIGDKVGQHLQRPGKLAPRSDRLRRRVRRHPQALRPPARARGRLDHGVAPSHSAASHPLPGRLDSGRGRGAPHLLPVHRPGRSAGGAHGMGRGRSHGVDRHPHVEARAPSRRHRVPAGALPGGAGGHAGHRRGGPFLHWADAGPGAPGTVPPPAIRQAGHQRRSCGGRSLAGLPVCWWLRRFTRAPVFSLMFATTAALWCLATLLRMGMLDWLDHDHGRFYFHLLPCAVLFMAAGFGLERLRRPDDSRYFYPFAVGFTWAALSGVAADYEPYARWLQSVAPWTRGQVEYLFIGNAAIYFVLDRICERLHSPQVRAVGKAFRFVIPGHVMTSLWLLGLNDANTRVEERILEWLLPAVACVFVFGSIPRQMKNFFASGLLFLAIGIYRLQQDVFPNHAGWPVFLLAAGLALMAAAANYAPLKVALARLFR